MMQRNIQRMQGQRRMAVLQFPEKNTIMKRLDELQVELEHIYVTLENGYELLSQLENKRESIEKSYNGVLKRCSETIGIENLPVGYLEWATENVVYDTDTGEIRWELELEEEE